MSQRAGPMPEGPAHAIGAATAPAQPVVGDRSSVAPRQAAGAVGRCALGTASLLLRRRLRQPDDAVGSVVNFADGTSAAVYRETAIDRPPAREPTFLAVSFRLRLIRSPWAHAAFRAESALNTVLFAGFPGLVSKLWLRHDQNGVYRGLYEWDGTAPALAYVDALWWVLALVSVPGSIRFALVPGLKRDDALTDPGVLRRLPSGAEAWWRPVSWSRTTAPAGHDRPALSLHHVTTEVPS